MGFSVFYIIEEKEGGTGTPVPPTFFSAGRIFRTP